MPLTGILPHIVGIAGATCSGKSLLARQIKEMTSVKNTVVISIDSYYRDLSAVRPDEREHRNFDTPDSIEAELLYQHLAELAAGNEIPCPVYDFSTHTRSADVIRIVPGKLIILEGLFVLYWKQVRQLLNAKVFVLLDETISLSRRIQRDIRERGRTRQSVVDQFNKTVKPMTEKYVLPTRSFADILVSGEDPIEKSSAEVIRLIHSLDRTAP